MSRGVCASLAVICTLAAAPAAALAGSISGTVKSTSGGGGIAGIVVCASSPNFGVHGGCTGTAADGTYEIGGLQADAYEVDFNEEGRSNYVSQWYPLKPIRDETQFVEVEAGETSGIDALLEVGGQIAGTVTDVANGVPITGVEVCATQRDRRGEWGLKRCDKTDPDGLYAVQALPTGLFTLEFGPSYFGPEPPNYVRQYYPGKANGSEAQAIHVDAGTILGGIDAALQAGIRIDGTVRDEDGAGLSGSARVCALDAVLGSIVQCAFPSLDGSYWLTGLALGSYKVSFAVDVEDEPGLVLRPDGFVPQYYNGKPTFGEADALTSAVSTTFSGIDARLVKGSDPPRLQTIVNPAYGAPTPVPNLTRRARKPLVCKKGSRKRRIKGRARCVRVHKKQRRHSHQHHG